LSSRGNIWADARVAPRSAWAWDRVSKDLSSNLSYILNNRLLPIDGNNILIKEAEWQLFIRLTGKNETTSHIACEEIMQKIHYIQEMLDVAPTYMEIGYEGNFEVDHSNMPFLLSLAEKYCGSPTEVIPSPWITPEFGTAQTLDQYRERVADIFEGVIEAYENLANSWFARFKGQMATFSLLPAKVNILVTGYDLNSSTDPYINWHFDPLPTGEQTTIDVNFGEIEGYDTNHKKLAELYAKLRAYRPQTMSWMSIWMKYQRINIFGSTPATEIVYELLWDDFKSMGFLEGEFNHRW
jgi:hypothetical protein